MIASLARVFALACLLSLTTTATTTAHAQQRTSNKIAAEALFDRGLALMQEGKHAEACDQLEQSQALDAGIGTMLYLAECYERLGRTASAWALFREASSRANAEGQTERAQIGASRAAALEGQLPKLVVAVDPENPADLSVLRQGQPVQSALFGIEMPVDPGEHTIEASAPGKLSYRAVAAAQAGTVSRVEVPRLQDDPNAAAQTHDSSSSAASGAHVSASDLDGGGGGGGGSTQRIIGLVVGGVGVVALGVGSAFGLTAISKKDDADQRCSGAASSGAECSDARGVALNEDAQDAAMLANVFMIGGAVLAATGVVVYLTAPSDEAPRLAVHPGGLSLQGAF